MKVVVRQNGRPSAWNRRADPAARPSQIGRRRWLREQLTQMRRNQQPARLAVTVFLTVIAVVTVLLSAPWATQSRHSANPINALFTATSAVCVTGLEAVPTGTYWSTYGHIVILAAIKVGGLGVMTIGAVFGLLVSRRLGLTQRLLAASETKSALGQVGLLVRAVAITSTTIELLVALLLWPRFTTLGESAGAAAWHALFYGVSAFNNAGFSPTAAGLTPFFSDFWVLVPIMLGAFIGALGFPVIFNLARRWRHPSQWVLHTKLTLATAGILAVLAPIIIGLFEWRNPATIGTMSIPERLLNAGFAGLVPRTAGFSIMPQPDMQAQTMLVQEALMFIGGGSASTAGGIKVTTVAVMFLAIRAEMRGDRDIEAFSRRIAPEVLRAAVGISVAAVVIVFTAVLVLLPMTNAPTDRVVFESVSAFATGGLSTGLSATLPTTGKLTLVVLMLIGRLGTMTLAAALALSNRRSLIRLPEERPIVG